MYRIHYTLIAANMLKYSSRKNNFAEVYLKNAGIILFYNKRLKKPIKAKHFNVNEHLNFMK